MASITSVFDLSPLTKRTHDEHGNDGHAASGDNRAGEDAQAEWQAAVTLTLQRDE
jgi:hypothetical protein